MVKSWNGRLNTTGSNGIEPPRTVGGVVEGQSIPVPTARRREGLKP